MYFLQQWLGLADEALDDADVQSVEVTAANVSDVVMTGELLHGNEDDVYGDAGYIGAQKRDEPREVDVTWSTAEKPSRIAAMDDGPSRT